MGNKLTETLREQTRGDFAHYLCILQLDSYGMAGAQTVKRAFTEYLESLAMQAAN